MADSVKVYALSTCAHCANAKKFLDDHDVRYDCVHVDMLWPDQRNEVMRELVKLNPSLTFPTIVINGKPHAGCDRQVLAEALGLDVASDADAAPDAARP